MLPQVPSYQKHFFFSDCPSKTPDIKCPLVLQSRWGLRKDQGPPLTPPPGFCTSSDPQRVAWYSIMGGILGMLPGPSIAYTLQGSCPRPQPLPSLKLQQNEGTLRGLGTGIQETKTADPDKKANGTECACPRQHKGLRYGEAARKGQRKTRSRTQLGR